MEALDKVTTIKGIGEKTAALLQKLSIETVSDLVRYYPRRYDTYESPIEISRLKAGERCSVLASIASTPSTKIVRNLTILEVIVRDSSAALCITFFNRPYLKNQLRRGAQFVFRGLVSCKGTTFVMEQPELFQSTDYASYLHKTLPIYSLTKGLSNTLMHKALRLALDGFCWEKERFPTEVMERFSLMDHETAMRMIHFPVNERMLQGAVKRIAFEEFYDFLYELHNTQRLLQEYPNGYPIHNPQMPARYLDQLPFSLTNAQSSVWLQICKDLAGDSCMNRLIQGDVGSGKTILAILALLACVEQGYQGAFMAPTEVLARQHYLSITADTEKFDLAFRPVLLTGSMSAKEKREAYSLLSSGEANLAIGTHALIQGKVNFSKLALVITDEQHRFGVVQRDELARKGNIPHVLSMSATPIPRSLAITIYGNLPISMVDELPANRLRIKSCVVNTSYRPTAYRFLQQEVNKGHQVYVICPLVEAGEEEDEYLKENVGEYTRKLQQALPQGIRIQSLHGKMRAAQKSQIMEDFSNHQIDILVSTTVIEVGINHPTATVMMIENAECFGLSQLHQLRGRVGRGTLQSYCIFISDKEDAKTQERLKVLLDYTDGYEIANQDLKLRGPGDFHVRTAFRGIRQSGELEFHMADIYEDADVLADAKLAVEMMMTYENNSREEQ
ncbi:MAG: ATP-dependent DNA helicase RecG [Lachnospiraceae bacterium]|nr:ATP-dependent DNA helicase RecG [Lachnospiraceae bacterium]